ncbi:MAG TPA: DedA family protein [Dehalococcoidia bacterium]|nr:DedA family protein [Dehalococcoidia bacterium]
MSDPFTATMAAVVLTSPLDILEWLVRLPLAIFHGYASLLRWAANTAQTLFEDYGYWVVFVGTLSENTLLVGLIVPGALVVLLAGLAAQDGTISVPLAIVAGFAGTVIGDTISYNMGRYGWSRFGHVKFLSDLGDKVREPILRRGFMFVLFYHFAGYTRVIGPTSAGMLRMPYRRWAPADYLGGFLWICSYLAAGYALGALGFSLDASDHWFNVFEYILFVAICVWVYFILRSRPYLLQGRLSPDEPEGDEESLETV